MYCGVGHGRLADGIVNVSAALVTKLPEFIIKDEGVLRFYDVYLEHFLKYTV